jgi:hypothetical protein
MSGILFVVGALTAVVGAAMVGFGVPVKEFSFGNTLIQAGVTAVVGGLIIVALGFVVAQLHRLAEALSAKSPIRSTRPMDMFDNARAARAPFPAKSKSDMPKAEMPAQEPFAHHDAQADHADDFGRSDFAPSDFGKAAFGKAAFGQSDVTKSEDAGRSLFAPSLRNPEESHVTLEDDVSLSPQQAPRPSEIEETAPEPAAHDREEPDMTDRHDTALDADWRPASRPAARQSATYFDAMWPSDAKETKDTKPASSRAVEDDYKPFTPKPLFDPKPYEPKSLEPKFDPPHNDEPAFEPEPDMHTEEPAAEPVAILKSGVVDGMAYTLYVDGSIEAELPQGTLRFASINELRAHLEKNG